MSYAWTFRVIQPTSIEAVEGAVKKGYNDEVLNEVISDYLISNSISQTVEDWRIENYSQLRQWAYPDIYEFLSTFERPVYPATVGAWETYSHICEQINERFPPSL